MSTQHLVLTTGPFTTEQKAAWPRLKRLSAAQLRSLLKQPNTRLVLRPTPELAERRSASAETATLKALKRMYGQTHPELVASVLAMPPDARSADGKGFALRGRHAVAREMVLAGNLLRSPATELAFYSRAHSALLAQVAALPALRKGLAQLASPQLLRNASLDKLRQASTVLLDWWWRNRSDMPVVAASTPTPCGEEIGVGRNTSTATEQTGDMTEGAGTDRATPAADGLFARSSFPLKPHLTCIRNQADRGTCPAFGVIAAVEARISVRDGLKMNLSEQHLYKMMRLDWFPGPFPNYGDGSYATRDLFTMLLGGHVFARECDWDYNPSYQRVDHPPPASLPPYYTQSGVGYQGLAWSDTNHQAAQQCWVVQNTVLQEVVETVQEWVETGAAVIDDVIGHVTGQSNGHWVEKTVTRWQEVVTEALLCRYVTDVPASSGYRVTDVMPLYAPFLDWVGVRRRVRFFTDRLVPVVWCFRTTPAFSGDQVTQGRVAVRSKDTEKGGHCCLIVAAIDNAELPAGYPPGAGGGWFIVKNSWGTQSGDGGWYYVPYRYAELHTKSMDALLSITKA